MICIIGTVHEVTTLGFGATSRGDMGPLSSYLAEDVMYEWPSGRTSSN